MQGASFPRLAAIVVKKEYWKWNLYHKNDVYLSYNLKCNQLFIKCYVRERKYSGKRAKDYPRTTK